MSIPVAYIAGTFPARSETFVYREVRALRTAGWPITTVTLNDPAEPGIAEFADLEAGTIRVYGAGAAATAWSALIESLTHPLRTMRTWIAAWSDILNPKEPLPLRARAKLLGQAFMAIGLARRLRGAGARHVHCHFAHAPSTVGMYAARQLRVPFSFTGHANDLFQRRVLLRRKLERAAFVACISEWHRDFYRDIFPGGAARYQVIRCGVDVESWTPKAGAEREITPDQPLRVLSVCRLVEKKGIDTLLRGLTELGRQTGQAWRLTVAGDGPEGDALKSLARELGCADAVQWLGAVSNDRVRELMNQADVFALPSREDRAGDRDGIPVVLIEAMACGVPVIAGDLSAIRELVQAGRTGILIDGNRPEQLAKELAALTSSPTLRANLARAGREHVQAEFAMSTNISRLGRQFRDADEPG